MQSRKVDVLVLVYLYEQHGTRLELNEVQRISFRALGDSTEASKRVTVSIHLLYSKALDTL